MAPFGPMQTGPLQTGPQTTGLHNLVCKLYLTIFFYENISCGYSLEVPH